MRRLLLLFILCCVCAQTARPSELFTANITNGRAWQAMSAKQHLTYVLAVLDTISYNFPDGRPQFADGFKVKDYVTELDKLYSSRENILIPVPFLMEFCTRKFGGHSTQSELDSRLVRLRDAALTMAEGDKN